MAEQWVEDLMELVRKVMGYQTSLIEEKHGTTSHFVKYDTNQVHSLAACIANAVYGRHKDANSILCSGPGEQYSLSSGGLMPTQSQMQVVTLALSNHPGDSCEVVWTSDNKVIGSVQPRSNTIHIQTFGMQHEVKILPGVQPEANEWRLVLTFRLALDPLQDKK